MTGGGSLSIGPLESGSAELRLCAKWRYDAFLKDYGLTVEDSEHQLEHLAGPDSPDEVALLARIGSEPVGICLLVRDELDAPHDLTPWLASLFVVEHFRHLGIGRALVTAIEDFARSRGHMRAYLYTDDAEGFYLKCGWQVAERFEWNGIPAVLMSRGLV